MLLLLVEVVAVPVHPGRPPVVEEVLEGIKQDQQLALQVQ
jgi:hypothetical protein